jgi:hypothetical protein
MLIPFLLYTAAFVLYATVDVNNPRFNRPTEAIVEPPSEGLSLTLVITDEGFRMASGTTLALPESCLAGVGAGLRAPGIPLESNAQACTDEQGYPNLSDRRERGSRHLGPPSCAYDFDRLRQCVEDIKAEHPEEQTIIISGEPNIDYDVLIRAMDATRGTPESPLFPNVSLASGLA